MTSDLVVHVIDDDGAARDSLTFLLETAEFVVRAYESAKAFLNAVHVAESGCVITDVRMPEIGGIELLRYLKNHKMGWPVILVTGHADVPLAIEAIKQGAADFIEKPYSSDVLLGAVRAALNSYENNAAREPEKAEIQERMATLSIRERQVLDALLAGNINKIIAHELGISERAVEIHRANVMTKFQATSLSHLVRVALIASL